MYIDSSRDGTTCLAMDKNGKLATFLLWTTLLPGDASVKKTTLVTTSSILTDVPADPRARSGCLPS